MGVTGTRCQSLVGEYVWGWAGRGGMDKMRIGMSMLFKVGTET